LTKRYKLERVAPVDNRPPPDKNFGPKQMWRAKPDGTPEGGGVYLTVYEAVSE